jgi:BTB/POZ domain
MSDARCLHSHTSCVRRDLLADVASADELRLAEDAARVRLLISSMYDADSSRVSSATVKPLLELARKYNMQMLRNSCEQFIIDQPLSTANLPGDIQLTCTFGLTSASTATKTTLTLLRPSKPSRGAIIDLELTIQLHQC